MTTLNSSIVPIMYIYSCYEMKGRYIKYVVNEDDES